MRDSQRFEGSARRDFCRHAKRVVFAAVAIAGFVAVGGIAEAQTEKCESTQVKCLAKLQPGLLGCYAKDAAKGLVVDRTPNGKCFGNALIKYQDCVDKTQTKPPCPSNRDRIAYMLASLRWLDEVLSALDPAYPPGTVGTPNPDYRKCLAAQDKCLGKYAASVLGCYSKASGSTPVDPQCLASANEKFQGVKGCYTKTLLKPPCPGPSVATQLKVKTDAFAFNTASSIKGAPVTCTAGPTCPNSGNGLEVCNAGQCACPGHLEFTVAAGTPQGSLDLGWTGVAHDSPPIIEGTLTAQVTSCASPVKPCGGCTFTGPVDNIDAGAGQIDNHRCYGDPSIRCSSDTDCGGAVPCIYFAGAPLPLSAGGQSICMVHEFYGVGGVFDTLDGSIENGSMTLSARVFAGILPSQPCPQCVGDSTPNDGTPGGTCNGGPNDGLACDANGVSPIPSFGSTSYDCPSAPGSQIASAQFALMLSTSEQSSPIAGRPNCRAAGFAGVQCPCDTCASPSGSLCTGDALCTDVPGSTCGGKRCLPGSGANTGTPCSADSECTPGTCGVPGAPTAPNACADGVCTETAGHEGECLAGPLDSRCVIESFRTCVSDVDCPAGGDTCQAKNRECYALGNAALGAYRFVAQGAASSPVNDDSSPTQAALFCLAPTESSALNLAWGLPGLGRINLTEQVRLLP